MENRIFIGTREDSFAFFRDVKLSAGFSSYKKLYPILGIKHGKFWFLQTGKRSLKQSKFETLIKFLPNELQEKYRSIITVKPWNWGEIKGGHITYTKLKDKFAEGRIKANRANSLKAEKRFDITQPLTPEICEFLGAFAGDGFTNGTKSHYIIGFAGDSRYDTQYYTKKIIPIVKNNFNIQKARFRVEENCMWINLYSKALHKMITERFKMPAGVKFDKVLIPEEIMQGRLENKIAFVRGTFDTDGCVFFDNRKTYKEPYMRVDICMYNLPILTQIQQILTEVGIESDVLANGKHIHVTSKENVRKFFEIVGSANERHISKIEKKYADFRQWNPVSSRQNPLGY